MFTSATKILGVALCAVVSLTAGCASPKQAGLTYSSAVSMGLGMEVKTADPTAPVSINIGFKTLDVAYVPVAVVETNAAGKENVEKIWASHSQQTGQAEKCRIELEKIKAAKAAKNETVSEQDLPSECDSKRDAMSVFGQFNGDAGAKGNDRSAGLLVGRVFATGIAAQNVSAAAKAIAYTDCANAVTASKIADDKRAAETMRVCGGHRQ
jgi:hypothetical protein